MKTKRSNVWTREDGARLVTALRKREAEVAARAASRPGRAKANVAKVDAAINLACKVLVATKDVEHDLIPAEYAAAEAAIANAIAALHDAREAMKLVANED